MTEDQQREAFEAWAKGRPVSLSSNRFGKGSRLWPNEYIHPETQLAWEAWQAAIQWRESRREK